jgi:hypothetical protein
VSSAHHNDGIPRARRALDIPPGGMSKEEDWSGANNAKADKLRVRSLQQRARTQGLELRHSDSGYALIDSVRKPIQDRRDMTLDEIDAWLDRG